MAMKKYDQNILNEVNESLVVLKRGGLLLYPTDTVWGIGCDATNANAIDKIYALKKRKESKALICLVSDMKMLNQFVEEIPEVAYNILKYASQPTTIIYDKPIRIAENLVGEDNTLGIRIVQDEFCRTLIKKLGKPLVSTSANISGEKTPMRYPEISQPILEGVDYIVNLQRKHLSTKSSTIIKLSNDGQVKILRK
ncbi:L-threonylcarbamoyladenylate synthase [Leeuwenhoekiella palythoae]|uniref:L-threonylcarbamoyladenylate synthase n=1 Tax=Leeuwenhoekiella palythoae TaxID=573501 RepID=UPI0035197CE5